MIESLNSTTKKKLSVVLSSFNYASVLGQALDSIFAQSYPPDEFIIIDDASTDKSADIINTYAERHSFIRFVQNSVNQGILPVINHGLKLSRCEYIGYTSADDIILPDYFQESVALLDRFPRAAFCTALAFVIDKKGRKKGLYPSPIASRTTGYISPSEAQKLMWRYGFWFVGNATVFRRDALQQAGGFASELGPLSDSFVTQVLALEKGFCFIPKPMAAIRVQENSYSRSTRNNVEYSFKIMENATKLMHLKYNQIFPKKFVDLWRLDHMYYTGINTWKREVFCHTEHMKNDILPFFNAPPGPIAKIFDVTQSASSWIQTTIVRLYFFAVFKHWRYWLRKLLGIGCA